jgi:hypothetical protein
MVYRYPWLAAMCISVNVVLRFEKRYILYWISIEERSFSQHSFFFWSSITQLCHVINKYHIYEL